MHGVELAEDLVRFVNLYGAENIAACFVEPIAGSTGCLVPPKGYLKRLREICDAHGILLVFDEVITGFGRTGQAFAAQSFGVTPDLMTMAKGITNGAQPMGAVAISERIHDTIMGAAPEGAIEFFHGYTYSGHPARVRRGPRDARHLRARRAVRAGPRAVAVFPRGPVLAARRAGRRRYPRLRHDRRDRRARPTARRAGAGTRCRRSCSTTGCISRPPATAAIVAPPLIAERAHVDEIVDILRRTLKSL